MVFGAVVQYKVENSGILVSMEIDLGIVFGCDGM